MRLAAVPRRLALLAAVLLVTGVCGCSQLLGARAEVRERRKFIIEADRLRLDLPRSERPYEMRVQIERFSVSRFYDKDQIVFRLTPEEIRDDRYNSWAVRPSEMVTNTVADYLRRTRLFTDLRDTFLDATPDYTLTGTIDAIERFDSGDRWYARLAATLQLVDRQHQIFWQYRFQPTEVEVFDADMASTVRALRDLLRMNMEQAIGSLDRALLIRKTSLAGGDVNALLEPPLPGMVPGATGADTSGTPRETQDYIIVPGKLLPED